jgi:hypothetical protein
MKFKPADIEGLEWGTIVDRSTPALMYRVEITWALDRYRIEVYRLDCRMQSTTAWYIRTAIKSANKFLNQYTRREKL